LTHSTIYLLGTCPTVWYLFFHSILMTLLLSNRVKRSTFQNVFEWKI